MKLNNLEDKFILIFIALSAFVSAFLRVLVTEERVKTKLIDLGIGTFSGILAGLVLLESGWSPWKVIAVSAVCASAIPLIYRAVIGALELLKDDPEQVLSILMAVFRKKSNISSKDLSSGNGKNG